MDKSNTNKSNTNKSNTDKPNYLQKISLAFKKQHILFFIVIIIFLHLIDSFLIKYSINVYQGSTILISYVLINSTASLYSILMGGVVATMIPFVLYNFLTRFFKKINLFNMGLLSFLLVLFFMTILDCLSIPALAYSLSGFSTMAKSQFQYLVSFIMACIFIIFLSIILLYLTQFVNKKNKIISLLTPDKFTQLEQNLGFNPRLMKF